jgi:hypothetical protein
LCVGSINNVKSDSNCGNCSTYHHQRPFPIMFNWRRRRKMHKGMDTSNGEYLRLSRALLEILTASDLRPANHVPHDLWASFSGGCTLMLSTLSRLGRFWDSGAVSSASSTGFWTNVTLEASTKWSWKKRMQRAQRRKPTGIVMLVHPQQGRSWKDGVHRRAPPRPATPPPN